jgi:hypothetical protein
LKVSNMTNKERYELLKKYISEWRLWKYQYFLSIDKELKNE